MENWLRWGRGFLLGLYAGFAVMLAGMWLFEPGPRFRVYSNAYGLVAVAGATLGLRRVFHRFRESGETLHVRLRYSPFWICLALLSWSVGQLLWSIQPVYPSWDDLFYLFAIVIWIAGVLGLFRLLERNLRTHLLPFLPFLIPVWGALGAAVFYFGKGEQAGFSTLKGFCDCAYVGLTSFAALLAVVLLLGSHEADTPPITRSMERCLKLLGLATVLDAAANISFTITTALPADDPLHYVNGNWVDLILLTAIFCMSVAILDFPVGRKSGFYDIVDCRLVAPRDRREAAREFDIFFNTPDQMRLDEASCDWIVANLPQYWLLARHANTVVGSTFVLPVSRQTMEDFLADKITERQMFETCKATAPPSWDCLYLAAAWVASEHRRRNLAFECLKRSVERAKQRNAGIELFCWAVSPEGGRLALKVSADIRQVPPRTRYAAR